MEDHLSLKEKIINTFHTPYIPTIDLGNAILKYLLCEDRKLKSIYLKENSHILNKILINMWRISIRLKKTKIDEKHIIKYLKKYKNKF